MGEDVEEPEFQYVPESPHVSPLVPGKLNYFVIG